MRRLLRLGLALVVVFVASSSVWSIPAAAPQRQSGDSMVYLPIVMTQRNLRRVNAPYFNVADVTATKFTEMSIFWFGRVSLAENYADVRVGYNNTHVYVNVSIFDRRLWYDETPSAATLTQWDSVTLYLSTVGASGGAPGSNAYRFDGQLNDGENPRTNWQAAYRGNGSGWGSSSVAFTTSTGYRWESSTVGGVNENENNRGWTITYRIPFSSLGLSGRPADGTLWGIGVALHDRDDSGGTPIADKVWPETMNANSPSTWGALHFGLPAYSSPSATSLQTATIRHRLNGASVPDAAVGGTTGNLCPSNPTYIWNDWGNDNFADTADFNIQNQSDLSDWPCFAKYYVTFPLTAIPAGKVIVSATLTLHQFGGSGDLNDPNPNNRPQPSLIQVFTLSEDWSDTTVTWNNAPLAFENVSRAWANPLASFPGWPGAPRTWDVSYAVAQAYARGQPLRLALYEADSAYHSGKHFVSSDTGDWNAAGRPTLAVRYGNP
jgi:hypothetical protein